MHSPRAARVARARPRLIGELLIVLVLVGIYDFVRRLAPTREAEAMAHGRGILRLEAVLRLDVELAFNRFLTGSRALTELAAGWYQFAHLTVTLTVLACCYVWRPELYRSARNSLVVVNVIGLVVFWAFPVAPPRLLPGLDFIDAGVLAGYGSGPAGPIPADQFAAMPSLHVAWATWTVIVLRAMLIARPWPRRLIPAYAALTSLVVVVTANHYLLDVVAGIAVGLIASGVTGLTTASSPGPVGGITPPVGPMPQLQIPAAAAVYVAGAGADDAFKANADLVADGDGADELAEAARRLEATGGTIYLRGTLALPPGPWPPANVRLEGTPGVRFWTTEVDLSSARSMVAEAHPTPRTTS